MSTLRGRLLEWLRIPPEPSAPIGDEHVRIFRAAPSYFRYRLLVWAVREVGGLAALIAYLVVLAPRLPDGGPESGPVNPFAVTDEAALTLFRVMEIGGILVFIVQAVVSGALLRLDFEQRWYIVSDRSLRIREGLVRLREKTMTFANVQHVAIRQNPIQRWLGIADLEVRSAGGGGSDTGGGFVESLRNAHAAASELHVGHLRGIQDPEGIRDVIRQRLGRHADAGLGDPEAPAIEPAPPAPDSGELAMLARAFRDEARALHLAIAQRGSAQGSDRESSSA